MSSNKIIEAGGYKLDLINPTNNMFLDKSVCLYGSSKSGKTFMAKYLMMNVLNGSVPSVFLFCPSADQNKNYYDHIYRCATYLKIDKKFIDTTLTKICERQAISAQIYRDANDINILESIYEYIKTPATENQKILIEQSREKHIKRVDYLDIEYQKKQERKDNIIEDHEKLIINLYKTVIRRNLSFLKTKNLSKKQLYSLEYLDFNPRILFIFDDCIAELKKFINSKNDLIKNLFFRGRHLLITQFFLIQEDTELIPGLRKNAHLSIFCSSSMATSYFEKSSNGIQKAVSKKALSLIDDVYKNDHVKLIFMKDEIEQFKCIKAEKPLKGKFGSKDFIDLCDDVENKEDNIDENNSFYDIFKI